MSISTVSANEADSIAVFHRLEEFYNQLAIGDLDSAMTLYTSDAQVIQPDMAPVVGTDAIRTWWQETLKEYEFQVSPQLTEVTDIGNAIVLQGKAKGTLGSKSGGASVNIDLWFMQIYKKQQDGSYLFWRGTSGSNPKPTK